MEISLNGMHILIQGAIFFFVVLALSKFIFNPVLRVIAERESRMSGDKKEAKRLVEMAQEQVHKYEEKMEVAKTEAKEIKAKILKEASGKERGILNKARDDSSQTISTMRQKIVNEGKAILPQLTQEAHILAEKMAEIVLGRRV